MIEIIKFFSQYSPWIFILIGLLIFFFLRKLVIKAKEKKALVFGLEREIIHNQIIQSITALVILGLLFLAELILVAFLLPNLPGSTTLATSTMSMLNPSSITSIVGENTESFLITTTPTNPLMKGCIPDQIYLEDPKPGQEIRGKISLIGTVDILNFGFYKYEYAIKGDPAWSTILAGREIIKNGELGFWDTSEIINGEYELRLVVSINDGTELPPCVIDLRVMN